MTEIDDLSVLFQQRPQYTDEQQAYIERVQEFEKQMLVERMQQVMFFSSILCNCSMYFDRESGMPTQATCPIHGMLMSHPYTGELIMPGMPVRPGVFTSSGEWLPTEGITDDEEER
jgi:hypothetical protein